MDSNINNKRIAKNTFFLYGRMLFALFVNLFTARIILQALGVEDYGLNNVVGGVVSLFTILTGSMNTATSRFLTVELGKRDIPALRKVFSNAVNLHLVLAIIVVLLEETLGLYVVNEVLIIPDNRLLACDILYQTIVVSSFLTLVQVPCGALILSYEYMDVYAIVGVGEFVLRLIAVLLVMISPFDKLITLAVLYMFVSISVSLFQILYCRYKISEVFNLNRHIDRSLIRTMLGFSGWNLIGSAAFVLRIQGVNILLNMFFGAVVNAANAIAYQVNTAINGFVSNFSTAVNPQIIKSYSADEYEAMKSLIFRAGKFTFYLMMFLCFPVLLETDFLLHVWLGDNIPDYTIIMTRLILVISMVETFTYSIGCAINATGRIRNYQLVICGIMLSIFPITWILFRIGMPPYSGLGVYLFTSITALLARFYFMKHQLNITPSEYTRKVYMHTVLVSIISLVAPVSCVLLMADGWVRFLIVLFAATVSNAICIWCIGLDKSEKQFVKCIVNKIIKR